MNYSEESLKKHLEKRGKIEIKSKFGSISSKEDLAIAYTPGVGAVSKYVSENPESAKNYTIKGNTVAVVSDGSAVLGLGNIGPLGALPVMEGKALLFKEFANLDAIPIVLDTQDTEEIIRIIKGISPTFGGINLEDISAPRCFEIEARLKAVLDIPVMHDDQHGTAIVVLAGLINASKVKNVELKNLRIVINGSGAAGIAIANLLHTYGIENLILCDSKGILSSTRTDLNPEKPATLKFTNKENLTGSLEDALVNSDVFVGVSVAGALMPDMIKLMNKDPFIFALANPIPEIMPDEAKQAGAFIIATGRSDFPNQINNVLAFPGIFRGAIDNGVRFITDDHKIKVAEAIASAVDEKLLSSEMIIPSPLDKSISARVAEVIIP